MKKQTDNNRQIFLLALTLMALALIFRFIPHPPNFSPILSIAFFSGFIFRKPLLALGLPLGAIFISDLFLGFYQTMITVYLSLAIIVGLSWMFQKFRSRWFALGLGATLSSTLFFLTTNFSVWLLTPMYPKSWEGLVTCYAAAIPFFHNSLISTLLYSTLLFGAHSVFEKKWVEVSLSKKAI